ncbi:(2Fe-2S)-binding protein [candidate division KSB1 bacterium]|nr:(2Fe-2S)-binding protein [candidate division KSB1 bacterium]
MIQLTINDQKISVAPKTTILQAANQLNVAIPTMCHLDGMEPFTSCMICVVQETQKNKLLPACSTWVDDDMVIETDNDIVREARKTALELLLSEHVGDCEAPCQRICPAHMNIPLMIRQIQRGDFHDALITVKKHIALPAVLGRICPAPCENGCRRKQQDTPVSICLLKRFVADVDLHTKQPWRPTCAPTSGKKVAVIGAGPAGLTAAYELAQKGHACTIYDDHAEPGGTLRYAIDESVLPREVLANEIRQIAALGVKFQMESKIDSEKELLKICKKFDAVLLAIGTLDEATGMKLGVPMGNRGVLVSKDTYAAELPNVFAAGGAIRPSKMAVTSVGDGWAAAYSIDHFLQYGFAKAPASRFNSTIGRLNDGEIQQFMKEADTIARREPEHASAGLIVDNAVLEATRCLHCDCRKPDHCKLRDYADEYNARQQTYRSNDRRLVNKHVQHDIVIYESGKCIKCGLCVHITERAKERLGMTFIGRGFDVEINVPLGHNLRDGLSHVAEECAAACPTGALAMKKEQQ